MTQSPENSSEPLGAHLDRLPLPASFPTAGCTEVGPVHHQRLSLRRLMHNRSGQEVREVAQRSAKAFVEALPARVSSHIRGQQGEQATQGLGPVALQGEAVLQLRDDSLD